MLENTLNLYTSLLVIESTGTVLSVLLLWIANIIKFNAANKVNAHVILVSTSAHRNAQT